MGKFKNYYELLGVEVFADAETVKSSFRKMARQYHPDLNAGNQTAEEKFKEINEAYETLSDPEKRGRYDQSLKIILNQGVPGKNPQTEKTPGSPPNPKPTETSEPLKTSKTGPNSSTPINDLFDTFRRNFQERTTPGNKASGEKSATTNPQQTKKVFNTEATKRGEDVSVEALISPLEAELGTIKTVNIQHKEICRRCSGTGRVNGLLCTSCQGEKATVRLKKIDVRIPAGVKHGSKVRIAGEGGRGLGGAENGDLFLQIRVDVDQSLRIDGLNVYCDLLLSIPEAVLGAELEIPTLNGKVKMTIPALTSSGKVFRLKEQGVQNGMSKGDQFVTIQIMAPESISPREKELYQELARLRPDPPRKTP